MFHLVKSKKVLSIASFTAFLAGLTGNAMAALTAEQQAAVDAISTFVTDMTTVAWAFVLSITGALIAIKLYKKFVGKSS